MPSLTLQKRIKAPASKVYSAWTNPQKMVRWFSPEGATVLLAEADLRVGGRFRVLMQMPDGTQPDVSGVYMEIMVDTKLVFTWVWADEPTVESLVTVKLLAVGDATELTLIHEKLPTDSSRDGHEEGWTGALKNLGNYLENEDS